MLRREKNKIIEFFGLSGSGKTTIVKSLESKNPKKYKIIEVGKFEKFLFFILFAIFNQSVVFYANKKTNSHEKDTRKLIRHLFIVSSAKFQKAKIFSLFSKKKMLIDESLLQRVLSIFHEDSDFGEAREFVNKIPIADKVVVVSGGDFERYLNTEKYPKNPRSKDPVVLESWIQSQKKYFDIVFSEIQKIKQDSVVLLKNEDRGDLDILCKSIDQRIS